MYDSPWTHHLIIFPEDFLGEISSRGWAPRDHSQPSWATSQLSGVHPWGLQSHLYLEERHRKRQLGSSRDHRLSVDHIKHHHVPRHETPHGVCAQGRIAERQAEAAPWSIAQFYSKGSITYIMQRIYCGFFLFKYCTIGRNETRVRC